ncbi:hypothetical protein SM007_38400 [Streptomyces avermitilis]|nr:hypothetical protein SM007_38400 [Streptomyces avermitilis]
MAADYAEQIRTVQPAGPYRLLGWSIGGVIAQAVATRLQELGEDVEFLALLDAYPGGDTAKSKFRGEEEGPQDGYAVLRDRGALPDLYRSTGMSDQVLANLEKVLRNMSGFAPDHTPRLFQGNLLLFVATADRTDDAPAADAAESWRPHIEGDIETHEVSVGHHDMLRPEPLSGIARVVARWLEQPRGTTSEKAHERTER